MASKLINVRWIRTSSQPNWKIMFSIVLQKFSTNDNNKIIKLIPVLLAFGLSGLTNLVLILKFFI